MNQNEENLLARLHNVGGYLQRHAATVAGGGALALAVAAFVKHLSNLPAAPESETDAHTAGTAREGAKKAKDTSRVALAGPAVAMLSALRLYHQARYATTHDLADQEAAAEMTLKRPASLRADMPTGQLLRLMGRALSLLDALPTPATDLVPYNHDETKITRFRTLAGQFGAVAGAPRAARDQAKHTGETFASQLRAARTYVKTELSPAVDLLADDNPEFVKGFKQANKQDNRRGGHASRTTPKPPTP